VTGTGNTRLGDVTNHASRNQYAMVCIQLLASADNMTLLAFAADPPLRYSYGSKGGRICYRRAVQQSIDRYRLPAGPGPQQQTRAAACGGRMMGQTTDGKTNRQRDRHMDGHRTVT